jgi:hypothetical protein
MESEHCSLGLFLEDGSIMRFELEMEYNHYFHHRGNFFIVVETYPSLSNWRARINKSASV